MNSLLPVIRAAFDIPSTITITAEECEELAAFGKKQSILPVVYTGLKKMDLPADQLKEIDRERNRDLRKFVLHNDALEKIESALSEEQIAYIPLKGSALRHLYPAPEMRTSCDIDVLVHEEDIDRAVAAIEQATDFAMRKRNYHDISMADQHSHLELHFSLKENMGNIDKLLSHVWNYAVPCGESRHQLTPEFQVFHVIAHMSYHMVHGGLGIRPFLDLWLLRTKTSYDENTVRRMCADCGILVFYEKCGELTDAWMEGKPVPEDLSTLAEYVLSGGVFGSRETALASKQRVYRGYRYILHRAFMDRALLETEYPELKEKPYLSALGQVKRWMRLTNPQKRNRIKSEIASIKAMRPESVGAFDRLLTSLGL